MAFFNKSKEPEMLSTPRQLPKELVIPEPPKMFKEQAEIDKKTVIDGIVEKLEIILTNQEIMNTNLAAIYALLKKDDPDLEFVPEEDKETYIALKQSNPKMAEKLLKEYKAVKK